MDAQQQKAVDLLVSRGVNPNIRGFLGSTAVARAVRTGNAALLESLLRHKELDCLDAPNDKLQYPLHIGAFHKMADSVKLLLKHGADPLVVDRKARTPDQDTTDASIRNMILAAARATAVAVAR